MSTQKLASNKPRIGKWMLIAVIATSCAAFLFLLLPGYVGFGAAILSLLLSFAAAIFYLIREEQAAAARVWGIGSGLPLAFLAFFSAGAIPPFVFPFIMAIGGFIMAIGGIVLALKRPKFAGALMLAGAVGSVAAFLVFATIPDAGYVIVVVFVPCLLAISFLIPGGILALTSRKGQPASKKMIVGAIAAFFAIPVLGPALYFLGLYIGLLK